MERRGYKPCDYHVSTTIRYPKTPIHFLLDMAASKYKDSPATDFLGAVLSYRVRGADLDVTPLNIITSDEVWSFYKQ